MEAHARHTDPETSHDAAKVVTPDLRELQRIVESYAHQIGSTGFTDAQMSEYLADQGSTFRTRRSELTDRNIILDSGQRRRWGDNARRRVVWIHRAHHPNPPPIIDPKQPVNKSDRERAHVLAAGFENAAKRMRQEGRAMFADTLVEGAELLRKL